MKNKTLTILALIIIYPAILIGQDFYVSGTVKSNKGEPIYLATISQKDGNRHAYTGEKGDFSIKLPKGKSTLIFSCMGFASIELEVNLLKDQKDVQIILKEVSLSLDEIVVVAKSVENKSGTSVYEIGEQAIKQVQATNLSDVLSLLPGKKITPPSLNSVLQPNLRTAVASTANNFGTAIILDGMQISNDGNMQSENPSTSISGGKNAVGMGIDLRSISTSGVDKVEVISGVASPKYGDITSGTILVKSKVGRSPLTISANLNPSSYQFSLNKGIQLKNKFGFLNTDVAYTYSDASPIDRKEYYHNINASLRWRVALNEKREWYNTTSFQIYTANNGQRVDPDEIYQSLRKASSQRYLIGISGSLKFLGTTNYSLTANLENQYTYTKSEMVNGPFPLVSGLEAGTFFTTYSPLVYIQETEIKGFPINLGGRLEFDQDYKIGDYRFTFNTGTQFSYIKNYGEGRIKSGGVVGIGGMAESRGANFIDIPASTAISAYHETNVRRITDISRQELRLGARYDFMNGRYHLLSPRLSYSFLLLNRLKLRASWGIAYKAPAMIQLHPGPAYHDYTNLSYYATNPSERLAIVSTYIVRPTNDHLKPSKGDTKEVGLDWEGEKFSIRTTYYHKILSRGIYTTRELLVLDKQIFEILEQPVGKQPVVAPIEGEIVKILRSNYIIKNCYTATTDGVETVIIPPKIEATNTTFNLSFSYMETVEYDSSFKMELPSSNVGEPNARYGVYENPIVTTKVSTGNLTIIQHIPSLRLVFNLVAELNFLNYNRRRDASLYPYAIYDSNGDLHYIPESEIGGPEYEIFKLPEYTYLTQFIAPFYTNYHLQVRKETAKGHSFSFFANNCFWYNPEFVKDDVRRVMNGMVAFGFGISLKIAN